MNKRNFIKAAVLGTGALFTNGVMASDVPTKSTFEPDCVSISDRENIGYIKGTLENRLLLAAFEKVDCEFAVDNVLRDLKEENKLKEYKCSVKNIPAKTGWIIPVKTDVEIQIKPIETDIWVILDMEIWVSGLEYDNYKKSLIK